MLTDRWFGWTRMAVASIGQQLSIAKIVGAAYTIAKNPCGSIKNSIISAIAAIGVCFGLYITTFAPIVTLTTICDLGF